MQSVKVGCSAASRALRSTRLLCPVLRLGYVTLSARCCSALGAVDQPRSSRRTSDTAAAEETTVIRIPRYVQKRVDDVKQARGTNKRVNVKAGKLLVQSKNADLNQSAGYILGKFELPVLSSKGWKHNKSFGDYFTINNVREVAPFVVENPEEGAEPRRTFRDLRVCDTLVETLRDANITHPTTVQLQTIPKVMKGHNVLCAAETGSGKTLCYLLPIVNALQALREEPEAGEKNARRLQAVVVVPSRELAEQVSAVSRTLCAPFDLKTKTFGGGLGMGAIKTALRGDDPDILVATPGALVKALRRRWLDFSELGFFVVDEADTMFDPSFSDMLEDILHHASIASAPHETRGPGRKAQLLLVGATFPGGVGAVLGQVTDLGSLVLVKSKMLHFLMPHVKQTFLKVKGVDKVLELHQALTLLQRRRREEGAAAALVFCNKSSTVNWLGYSLDEMGVRHARLHGEMPAAVRAGIFHSFQTGKVDVLVCTDIASRGLDTRRVSLVVNHDCPETHTDYIHRAGRVGRAGGVEDGEVLSFVSHAWDVELVQKIETAARRRACLPGMEKEVHEPKPEEVKAE